MDPSRFDALTRTLGGRLTRRKVLQEEGERQSAALRFRLRHDQRQVKEEIRPYVLLPHPDVGGG